MSESPTICIDATPLDAARRVLRAQSAALDGVASRLDHGFVASADRLANCTGRVALTGVGKSADVAAKIAGTFNSTGTRAYFLDATRALHGDLGMVHSDDVVVALSHSGESEELVRLIAPLLNFSAGLIAITSDGDSTIARAADDVIVYGAVEESGPLALAPSTSTTVMIALGDALASVLSAGRQFSAEEFAKFHPAGSLGLKLALVESLMRCGADIRVAPADVTVREVFVQGRHTGRRTGAVIVVDENDRLCGLFTDSDLAKLFERKHDSAIDRPVREVMTRDPITVSVGSRVGAALDVMRAYKISELPVVDGAHHPVGLLDVTDLIGLPARAEASNSAVRKEQTRQRASA